MGLERDRLEKRETSRKEKRKELVVTEPMLYTVYIE